MASRFAVPSVRRRIFPFSSYRPGRKISINPRSRPRADDYIVKPFSPNELVARVKGHLARYEQLTSREVYRHVLRYGDLEIDESGHRVFVKGKEVALPNKEFELLLFFAKNPDIVFSKETLFDRVWGSEALGETATVSVHVNRIREKIEEDTANPRYIETVWGAGYRFRS